MVGLTSQNESVRLNESSSTNASEKKADTSEPSVLLRRTEQICLVTICVVAMACLLIWGLLSWWRSEQRIEFESIETQEIEFKIDVNQATEVELDLLPGIGPTLAERIVETRSQMGPYESLSDIQQVRGIGSVTAKRIEPFLIFDE